MEIIEVKDGQVFYKELDKNYSIPYQMHKPLLERLTMHLTCTKKHLIADVLYNQLRVSKIEQILELYPKEYIDVLKTYQQPFEIVEAEAEVETTKVKKQTTKQ